MQRMYGRICILAVLMLFGMRSSAAADRWWWNDDDSIYPRIIAKVTALDPRGLATIQADDDTKYEVVAGTGWRVGDTVQCERSDRERVPLWKKFDCRKY